MLQIKNVYKEYRTGNLVQKALDNVSLNLRDNEFVAILGPSGSGKTTLLNIIGGLDRYDKGDLIINEISTKKYKDRDWDSYRNHTIGFVFQSYNLIPHQTILSNVELALTISGVSKKDRKKRAIDALKQVGLEKQIHKKPNQLSGGQMQRVAIARALVNNPDIVLADEPTGALDSETSIQVMELLKEVAKDRLVVMVTHNPELAEEYATRIVNLKDGKIISDSDPYIVENKSAEAKHKNMGKTSMSFFTSLALSFNNLKTKKGRTFLTSFAGSIGIIGIALILSLSNGVNTYIKSVEEETLSEYPLKINNSGIDLTAMLSDKTKTEDSRENTDGINVTNMLTSMFSTIGSNDLVSLKNYLESDETDIKEYTKAIEYSYNVTPRIYSTDTKSIRQLNPNTSFSSLGIGSTTSSNSVMSSMMSTDVFFELPQDSKLYESQYDVKAGRLPTAYNECVLVLTSKGNISDFLTYTLGLRNYDELDKMIEQFSKEEQVNTPDISDSYSYEDMLKIKFKLVNASDCYEYDSKYKVWNDKSDNEKYMKNVIDKAEDIKIVGVLQPKEGVSAYMLQTGIYYPVELTTHVIENAENSKIVKEQLKSPKVDVFTGKKFGEEDDSSSFDMNSLFEIDTNAMKKAFKIDQSKIKVDTSSLNKAIKNMTLPEFDFNTALKSIKFSVSEDEKKALVNDLIEGYKEYLKKNNIIDIPNADKYLQDFIKSDEAKAIMTKHLTQIIKSNDLDTQVNKIMQSYMNKFADQLTKTIQKEMTKSMRQMASSIPKAISIDTKAFASAIKINMNEEELSELFASLMTKKQNTYDNNLKKLNYANLDKPDGISIYPKNFESNEKITAILEQYNSKMEAEGNEDKVISYTDMVGTLMNSVTIIVNVISYVLIAFVAISLVVSSIMIGVITYISVLERKKEIGILRAIGASKRNISQVFNAETFMIGLLAGIIGIVLTVLLLIPINGIIHKLAQGVNVTASLPAMSGLILIVLSTVLTLIGGLIPSKKAAKEDPVLALRSE